jgi:hypothetical protein
MTFKVKGKRTGVTFTVTQTEDGLFNVEDCGDLYSQLSRERLVNRFNPEDEEAERVFRRIRKMIDDAREWR